MLIVIQVGTPQRQIPINLCMSVSKEGNRRHMSQRVSIGGHSERGHHTDDKHCGPHDDSNVEDDAEDCIVPLGPSSGPQSRDGQDEGWDGEKEADEKFYAPHVNRVQMENTREHTAILE